MGKSIFLGHGPHPDPPATPVSGVMGIDPDRSARLAAEKAEAKENGQAGAPPSAAPASPPPVSFPWEEDPTKDPLPNGCWLGGLIHDWLPTPSGPLPVTAEERQQLLRLWGLLHDPTSWPGLGPRELASLVRLSCTDYAESPGIFWIGNIKPLYDLYQSRVPRDVRARDARDLAAWVRQGVSPAALIPVLVLDKEREVVAAAAQDLALLARPTPAGGPFTGPQLLLQLAEPAGGLTERARAGILMGLVRLGDRRLRYLLDGCWLLLGRYGRPWLAGNDPSVATAGQVEFALGWLEQTDNEHEMTDLLGMLIRLRNHVRERRVFDVEWDFAPPVGPPVAEPRRVLQSWTFPEYYHVIHPLLERIRQREGEFPATPWIRRYWFLP